MSKKILKQLADCNLKAAAFDFAKTFTGGVFKDAFVAALDVFTRIPCPETAINFVSVCPEALPLMLVADDRFVRNTPPESRGTALQGFEEWMESMEANLSASSRIQSFLARKGLAKEIQIGFHRLRDQLNLVSRLEQIGIRKGFFSNRRQYLRNTITSKLQVYRAVIDMVCIHGVHDRRERFWNGLGAEGDAQIHLNSEIMFEISEVADEFVAVLKSD